MSAPSWLALVAVVWWAALLNPAQSQRLADGLLDGVDLPGAAAFVDRQPSLHVSDRRRSESAREGNPPALAIAASVTIAVFADPVERIDAFISRPASQPARSPAQPRAPPAPVVAHAG